MFTTTLIALAIAAGGPSDPNRTLLIDTMPATGSAAASAAAPTKAKPTRYCITEVLTGSRIPNKACYTREEWLTRGVDPLAPNNR